MLYTLTTGQWPIVPCPKCNATFTGPLADKYFLAHRQAAHTAVIWVR